MMGGETTDTTDDDDTDDNDESSVPGNDAEMETESKEQHFVASPHDEDEDDDHDDDHHYDDDDNDCDEGDGSWLAITGHQPASSHYYFAFSSTSWKPKNPFSRPFITLPLRSCFCRRKLYGN